MKDVFFPYYVNNGRLLDIYAILNHGYSEYEEITLSSNTEKQKTSEGEISVGAGFKLFNFGGKVADGESKTDADTSQIVEKKIQTIPSMLKIVLNIMREKKYIKPIESACEGDFVELELVKFQINSIKMLLDEINDILNLCGDMQALTGSNTIKQINDFKKISKAIHKLCNGEEVIYENETFAIVGNVFDEFLYQAIKSDLTNSSFSCLCQIKRKYNNGTSLMKNTIFTKIKSKDMKDQFIDSVKKVNDKEFYDFDSVAISEINDKPVYEIEIIALYK